MPEQVLALGYMRLLWKMYNVNLLNFHVHCLQLKHYQASSKVMQRAEELYGKLKGLYMHPKLVVRPPKKKAVGGVGIRKRPPTMAELLNNKVNLTCQVRIVFHTVSRVPNSLKLLNSHIIKCMRLYFHRK